MTLPKARTSPRGRFSWSLAGFHPTPHTCFQESTLSCSLGLCPGPTQINRMTCTSSSTALAPCLSWPHPSMLLALTLQQAPSLACALRPTVGSRETQSGSRACP